MTQLNLLGLYQKMGDVAIQIEFLQRKIEKGETVKVVDLPHDLIPQDLLNFQWKRIQILERIKDRGVKYALHYIKEGYETLCYQCQDLYNRQADTIPCRKDYKVYSLIVLVKEQLQ